MTTMICHRTACTAPAHPTGWNRVTHGLYCIECTRLINAVDPSLNLFPLLKYETAIMKIRGGVWIIQKVEKQS